MQETVITCSPGAGRSLVSLDPGARALPLAEDGPPQRGDRLQTHSRQGTGDPGNAICRHMYTINSNIIHTWVGQLTHSSDRADDGQGNVSTHKKHWFEPRPKEILQVKQIQIQRRWQCYCLQWCQDWDEMHTVTYPITCECPMGGTEASGVATNLHNQQQQQLPLPHEKHCHHCVQRTMVSISVLTRILLRKGLVLTIHDYKSLLFIRYSVLANGYHTYTTYRHIALYAHTTLYM